VDAKGQMGVGGEVSRHVVPGGVEHCACGDTQVGEGGGRRARHRLPEEATGVRRQRHDRPVAVRRAADAAQGDDDLARPGVGHPPVVALHLDAVGAARVAEGKSGAGRAVGGKAS